MSDSSFLGAQRTPVLVNREAQLETIQRAIYHPDTDCNILFIRGRGGMGKSRLAEEILWRGGNGHSRDKDHGRGPIPDSRAEWDWTRQGKAIVGDLIDVSAPRMHARAPFMHAIRDALVWAESSVNFTRYDAAYDRFQSQRFFMGDFQYIQKIGQEVENEFLNDYRESAKLGRITLILDTVEKLYPIGGTDLLLQEGLLKPEDMEFYTYQWLLKQIQKDGFPNTTLILGGRAEEGQRFFDAIAQSASTRPRCKLIPMDEMGSFSLKDTRSYLQSMVDFEKGRPDSDQVVATIKDIVEDEARLETLWLYTGGQPVRLALYTDLIIEDSSIPERLQETPQEARKNQASLENAQKEIESGFIRLLFTRPKIRSEILKALVRAPRGLDTEQLHYYFSSGPEESPEDWLKRCEGDSEALQLSKTIEEELKTLKKLALIKTRSDGRLGLQDEVYRIYTNALATDEQRLSEQEARQKLYKKLEAWARHQFEEKLRDLTELQANAERQLNIERPSQAMNVSFPVLTKRQKSEQTTLRAEIQQWELEDLHYSLLQDFTYNFNNELFELADQKWMANDEDADAVIRAELWQLLEDPAYALNEFGKLTEWESLKKRGEPALHAFRRFARQNDANDWIKRFDLRKDFDRAIQFAEQLENLIRKWGKEKAGDRELFPLSWQNTLARSERALWYNHARLLSGVDIDLTLKNMEMFVQDLEKLMSHSQNEIVFRERNNEAGFIGHPAQRKIRRVISLYYNYIGYGYANQGNSSKAMDVYGKALRNMREVKFPHMEATTRNNLSRALSDRGHTRGRRLCLDALELRKKQGAEVPIAYSYNTLALIDNDHSRPDLAWVEAAIAVAYFRLAEDPRGLGLALLQLGEALRRLSKRKSEAYHLRGDSPEVVLEIAERAIDEAVNIFTTGDAAGETLRRVEAWIEKASLDRDLILSNQKDQKQTQRRYDDALYYFDQAIKLAGELKNMRLELDARVNIAWTHYHCQKYDLTEKALQDAENLLPGNSRFAEGKPPPVAERDDLHVYYQFGKIYGLRGRMALDQFDALAESVKHREADKDERRKIIREDKNAKQFLQVAAESYVLALAYAQLLSPRSSALTINYDSCYDHIKDFNLYELEDFQKLVIEAREKFGVAKITLADFGDLSEFLTYTFGLSDKGT